MRPSPAKEYVMPQRVRPTIIGDAALIRRDGSTYLYIQYYDPGSKRMRLVSSGAKDITAAQAAWPGVCFVESRATHKKDATPHQSVTIKMALAFYWNRHASALPSAEQAAIARRRLEDHFADETVAALADDELQQDYLSARHLDGVAARTIDRELSVLRAAIRLYAERHPGAPSPKIYHVALPETAPNWLSADQVAGLLRETRSPHVYLFMLLMLATAGRPDAILDLRWRQVDFRSRLIILNPDGRVQTAKKRPTVPVDDQLLAVLRTAHAAKTCDYVIEYGGAPINAIKRAFREAAARAGFTPGAVTPYTLRHTAATWMAQRGVSLWEIAGFLGHSDTRMVERTYAHHHPDYRTNAKIALSEKIATTGAASNPMIARLEKRSVDALSKRRMRRHQKRHQESTEISDQGSHNPLKDMVGAAGIEPATPTMST